MPGEDPLTVAIVLLALPVLGLNVLAMFWMGQQQSHLRFARGWPGGAGQSMAETRLRVKPALRAALTALSAALAMIIIAGWWWGAALALPVWLLAGILVVLAWNTLALWLWEIRYDRVGLSASVLIFWRQSHLWRELVEITDDIPFVWHFHFVDGTVLRVPKQLAGQDALMQMARDWLHHAGEDADARTARS